MPVEAKYSLLLNPLLYLMDSLHAGTTNAVKGTSELLALAEARLTKSLEYKTRICTRFTKTIKE
jgi:hypothetical protein